MRFDGIDFSLFDVLVSVSYFFLLWKADSDDATDFTVIASVFTDFSFSDAFDFFWHK